MIKKTTVNALRALPVNRGPNGSRGEAVESTFYEVRPRLVSAKLEEDNDIHLVIKGITTSGTMIVEFPLAPTCTANATVGARARMKNARNAFGAACGVPGVSSFTKLTGRATIRGIGFFDFLHGQTASHRTGSSSIPFFASWMQRARSCREREDVRVTQQARDDLSAFLNELETLLKQVDENPTWFPDDLQGALSTARHDIATAFEAARAGVANPEIATDGKLRAAGLTEDQLDLKLSGFRGVWERFRSFPTRVVFRRGLRWANVILGSLAGVVGAAGPIKEFKESVEAAIEDKDEEESAR